MPFYKVEGSIPKKRHTVFKNPKGGIYYEEHVSREGFSYMYSNLYHLNMPTQISAIKQKMNIADKLKYEKDEHVPVHFKFPSDKKEGMLYNKDVHIRRVSFNSNSDQNIFLRQADYDTLFYVQNGQGIIKSNFGNLKFHEEDYIVIPRGVIYQNIATKQEVEGLLIQSKSQIETPSRYRNRVGQLLEHSPYCERDIRTPELVDPIDSKGEFKIDVLFMNGNYQELYYNNHPFDVVGWDGYYFPWILNINDFEPITGSIHQPPPVHQTFQGKGFVVCSFVSRLFDYHKDAIPAPYPHSNVDSDEVIFYSKGNFMSRTGISKGSITYHPMGMPHGPQPGKYESSIGKKSTDELAVMIDTFEPLFFKDYEKCIDENYPYSWLEKK